MSKTVFMLIGVTYYILTIVLIVVILNLINKKERKKYENAINNLEREKNLIISASILSELNKVEPLISNSDLKQLYDEWQTRFKELKDEEVPKITDELLSLQELFNEKKYKDLKRQMADVELDICYVKTKANYLLDEIKSITLSEEKNRSTITKLKASYREIIAKYNRHKENFAIVASPLELQFENVDKLFNAFEASMERNAYQEVGKIVKAIDDTIGNLRIVIEEAPSIILMGKKMIPNKINHILKKKERMEKEGFNLEFLNLDYNITEANKKISDIFQRLNVLNLEDSIFELKTILDFFETTENDFDKEKLAKKIFEDYTRTILIKITKLNKITNNLYKKLDDIKFEFDLNDSDVDAIASIHKDLKKLRTEYDKIIELHRSKKSYYTHLAKELEIINLNLSKTEEKIEHALRTIGSLKEDELRAREQLDEIKELLLKSKKNIRDYKLPVVPENYYIELSEATDAINEMIKVLESSPIPIKILNTRVDTARDLVFKTFNTSKEIVKTAKMAEMAIVYGNRYRVNKEVDKNLTKAEISFYKGNFKKSLEEAIGAINIIEPGIHKRLMEEYR